MFSTSMLVACLAVIEGLVVANPIRKDPIHARQAIETQDAPIYCQVLGNERASLSYEYEDVSDKCQAAGLSNECCVSVMTQGPNHPMTEQDRNDLMLAIAEQSKKDGRFASSTHGEWTASFDKTILAAKDLVKSELLQVWFNVIQNIDLQNTSGMGDVILQIYDGTDDISNYMRISREF